MSVNSLKTLQSLQLAVCCLNVSEGRNQKIIESIAAAAVANQDKWICDDNIFHAGNAPTAPLLKCKSTVLSVYMDSIFDRGNITIAAPIEFLSLSIIEACKEAFKLIDLTRHVNPGHPRLGAVDLIPIHPITNMVPLRICSEIAHNVATELSTSIKGTSFFFYGKADEQDRGLVQRRKELNWFSPTPTVQKPDLGEYSCKYGVTGIGTTPYMSVLNVSLDTTDLQLGKEIAELIRSSNKKTGRPGIQSMAFLKEGFVDIACNIDTNCLDGKQEVFKTTFGELEQAISNHAEERGIKVHGQSVRGFTPVEAYDLACKALLSGNTCPWLDSGLLVM